MEEVFRIKNTFNIKDNKTGMLYSLQYTEIPKEILHDTLWVVTSADYFVGSHGSKKL